MKKISLIAALLAASAVHAVEVKIDPAASWKSFGAEVKAQDGGFTFTPQRNFSATAMPFPAPKLEAGEKMTVSFKVKTIGELKSDGSGLRFGLASAVDANKNEGYYFCLGLGDSDWIALFRKNPAAPGVLGGREPVVKQLKSGKLKTGVNSDKAVEFKLSFERTTGNNLAVKLYLENKLRFEYEIPESSGAKPFDQFLFGIGSTVNSFQVDDFKLELE